ncbi:MAG: hypothetical protein IJL97_00250, partial [Lachnospiraceae bacterium]|nr:hypothetical protein [Lachnospiraceae bacterium]
ENSGFNTQIESIGCMKLTVRALHGAKRLFRIPIGHKYVTIGEIEGDDIDIEYVHAKTVRGKCVIIGDGCEIDRLEYTDSINISDKAVVKEIAQI